MARFGAGKGFGWARAAFGLAYGRDGRLDQGDFAVAHGYVAFRECCRLLLISVIDGEDGKKSRRLHHIKAYVFVIATRAP